MNNSWTSPSPTHNRISSHLKRNSLVKVKIEAILWTTDVIADLAAAESAFVRCADFAALQLLHKLNNLPDGSDLIKAEVAAYFHKFDEAEKIYFHNERR